MATSSRHAPGAASGCDVGGTPAVATCCTCSANARKFESCGVRRSFSCSVNSSLASRAIRSTSSRVKSAGMRAIVACTGGTEVQEVRGSGVRRDDASVLLPSQARGIRQTRTRWPTRSMAMSLPRAMGRRAQSRPSSPHTPASCFRGRSPRLPTGPPLAASYDVAVLVGPSHFVALKAWRSFPRAPSPARLVRSPSTRPHRPRSAAAEIVRPFTDPSCARAFSRDATAVSGPPLAGASNRAAVDGAPDVASTIEQLAHALADGLGSRRALLVASTDLSHYFDASTAAKLDGEVCRCVEDFSPERLQDLFERYPAGERGRHVGCGIGPAIAVMLAARARGAREARVLRYAHSGEVSGDFDGVVGYLAAVMGTFDADPRRPDATRVERDVNSPC